MWGFPCNISATTEASDFKCGTQLEFAKAGANNFKLGTQHGVCQITRRRKGRHGPGLGELPKIWKFFFNIYTMAEASDFKFCNSLGLPKPIINHTHRKSGCSLGLGELPKHSGFSCNILQG